MSYDNEQKDVNGKKLTLSNDSVNSLMITRKWTMFFSVLGFIGVGFMFLFAVIMLVAFLIGSNFGGIYEGWVLILLAIAYVALSVVYIFPMLWLMKFSTNMQKALEQTSENKLTEAFRYLKSHFKFMGILVIVLFGIYVLVGLVAGIVALGTIF